MQITDTFVLPADVVLVRVGDLDAELRDRLNADADDVAVSRPGMRVVAKVVDVQTADILRTFKEPRSIIDAVLSTSRQLAIDPERLLRDSFPAIHRLIGAGFLRSASEPNAALGILPSLRIGAAVAGTQIVACVQAVTDVELYQARMLTGVVVALKVARPGSATGARAIRNERAILGHLNGQAAPQLLDGGSFDGREFAVMEWRTGVDAALAAFELRRRGEGSEPRELARLCSSVADAYAALHARGVIHADVHPRNILVDGRGAVTILDFGLALCDAVQDVASCPSRGGVGFYFEPEFAAAALAKRSPPPATRASDQYSLGALLYELYTGSPYVDFSLQRDVAFRQIVSESPVPFARRGAAAWPAFEHAIRRSLDKDPSRRFESVAEFAHGLRESISGRSRERSGARTEPAPTAAIDARLRSLLSDIGLDGKSPDAIMEKAPTCSVNFGAAGVAYALYRRAVVAQDGVALAAADVWATWAQSQGRRRGAFYEREGELTLAALGRASLYHTSCGVHAVRVLVASALGDYYTMRHGTRAFLRAARVPSLNLDLTLGRAGLLLGCAQLLDALPNDKFVSTRALRAFGAGLAQEISAALTPLGSIGVETRIRNLGIAHGWGGMLYALLAWHAATRTRPMEFIRERLRELGEAGQPRGRGLRWPWLQPMRAGLDAAEGETYEQSYMPGWCNGSAGLVFLWRLAHDVLGAHDFADLAEAAAWNAWEESTDSSVNHLCCGSAGRAYAMLAMYRATGVPAWLARGRELYEMAVDGLDDSLGPPYSLYKGTLGLAVLAHDLAQPRLARMPLFELESSSSPT